jgi:GTP cyclohydrolase I|tara:strand:- start:1968 stop:2666 length:699 start_codon:yes stop_codon:yes gene_type:complete
MGNDNTIELVKEGFANGISLQLAEMQQKHGNVTSLTEFQKAEIIDNAEKAFGEFLDALGVDWRNDPNSSNTPRRVAKAYVNDLWAGRYEAAPSITAFPSDGYDGIVFEGGIPLTSMCSHHHQTIQGRVHVAYIPGKDSKVIGLSKLNRLVEYFGRRGAIQEQLTVAIHNAVDTIINDNNGVAVMIEATHNCVQCRGVKHGGASMKTAKLTGAFKEDPATRNEYYEFVRGYDG